MRSESGHLLLENGVNVGAYRVEKGREYHPHTVGSRLVYVVGDVRAPGVVDMLDDEPGLLLGEHEPIAVVVVSGVLVIEVRRNRTLEMGSDGYVVPVLDAHQAVGVHAGDEEQYHVVQDGVGSVVVRGGEDVGEFERHLGAADLGGVYAASDGDDRARFPYGVGRGGIVQLGGV